MIVFSKEWFEYHQKKLLWLANHKLGRWFLRIYKDCPKGKKIIKLLPNCYTWDNQDGTFSTDFRTHNKFAKRLYYGLKPLWYILHFWDWIIADRIWYPQLSIPFRKIFIPMPFMPHTIIKIIDTVATGTEINPVGNINKIFSRFITKMDVFGVPTFFTKIATAFSSFYSTVKAIIADFIPLPIYILFSKSPNILFPSNPRFMTYSAFIANKTFRNLFSTIKTWFIKVFPPFKITFARTIFSFCFIWRYGKFIFTNCANNLHWKQCNIFSFSLSTLTAYPAAGAVSPCDGRVYRQGVNESFASIRTGIGTTSEVTVANGYIWLEASATSNQFSSLRRYIGMFDTSSLSNTYIQTATFSLNGAMTKINTLGLSDSEAGAGITSVNPASTSNLVAADYNIANWGATKYATDIGFSAWSNTAYNDFVFNSSGLASINKAGITKLGCRLAIDIDNGSPAWISLATSRLGLSFADQAGTTQDPKLVVTYVDASGMMIFFD